MEGKNDELVTFIRQDAEDLLRVLTSKPQLKPNPRAVPIRANMFGKTTSSGISLTAPGDVNVFTPTATGWALSSPLQTIPCWVWPTAIVGEKNVIIFELDGRHIAVEIC